MPPRNRRRNRYRRATVIIYFQKYPGKNRRSGIRGLEFVVRVDGVQVQTGTTDSRGRAALRFDPTKTANLDIMGMTYDIDLRPGIANYNGFLGMQERLNMLGYNSGPVDANVQTVSCDRALLNFQADTSGLRMDGRPNRRTQTKIKRTARL